MNEPLCSLDTEGILTTLAAERRRHVLWYFLDHETVTVEFDDLVAELAGGEGDPSPAAEREQVAIELTHVHIPKLAAAGLVEYDRRSGTVRYHQDVHVEQLLAVLRGWRE